MTAPFPSNVTESPWVIIGCGFTGTRLARRLLTAGAEVWATRRSHDASRELGELLGVRARVMALDLAALVGSDERVVKERREGVAREAVASAEVAQKLAAWLPRGAIFVIAAPPLRPTGRDGKVSADSSARAADEAHDASRASAEAGLIRIAHGADAVRIVYISSTGVYPPGDGSWVTEDAAVGPGSSRGVARLAAETAVLEGAHAAGIAAVSLRAAGIYGPGRGVPTRLHRGSYRIIGPGDTYVSRIHVDDLGTAIAIAGTMTTLPATIFNAADDEPACSRPYGDAVAEILGLPTPPSVPLSEVDPWVATMMRANRRISNRRLREQLGVELAYPTWREGLRQIMAEENIPDAAERARTRNEVTKPS